MMIMEIITVQVNAIATLVDLINFILVLKANIYLNIIIKLFIMIMSLAVKPGLIYVLVIIIK